MVSIKINSKNIDNILSSLGIIVLKYMEKNGDINNAVIFVPSVACKTLKKLKETADFNLLGYSFSLIEDKNLKNELVIIDKGFLNFYLYLNWPHYRNKCNFSLV